MSNAGRTTLNAALCFILMALSLVASAQTDADHAQHHPQAKSSAPAPAPKMPKASKPSLQNSSAKDAMTGMDSSMKSMRDMHEKMMAAKTPEERKALMADHMKAMQDGMAMMGKMKNMPGMEGKSMDAANHHQMMEKRMEMMTSMMQMMMDRMPANPEN